MNLLTEHVLAVGAILFCLGMLGFLTRRSLILMFLSLELMLAGVCINVVAYSRHHGNYQGQVFAIFILTVAACEAAIALALIVALYRIKPTLDVRVWRNLSEHERDPESDIMMDSVEEEEELPTLSPAGIDPLESLAPLSSRNGWSEHEETGSNEEVMKRG